LLPGNDGGRPLDLTRIQPDGYLSMIVEPVDESASEPRFDIVSDAPSMGEWRVEGLVSESGERWR
jgi:hypothetical protein